LLTIDKNKSDSIMDASGKKTAVVMISVALLAAFTTLLGGRWVIGRRDEAAAIRVQLIRELCGNNHDITGGPLQQIIGVQAREHAASIGHVVGQVVTSNNIRNTFRARALNQAMNLLERVLLDEGTGILGSHRGKDEFIDDLCLILKLILQFIQYSYTHR